MQRTLIPRLAVSYYNTDFNIESAQPNRFNFSNPSILDIYNPSIHILRIPKFSDLRMLNSYKEIHEKDIKADFTLTKSEIISFVDFPGLTFQTPCPISEPILQSITAISKFIEDYQLIGCKILNCFNINQADWHEKFEIVNKARNILQPLEHQKLNVKTGQSCVYTVSSNSLDTGKLHGKWVSPKDPQNNESRKDAIQKFLEELESVKVDNSDSYIIVSHSCFSNIPLKNSHYCDPQSLWLIAHLLKNYDNSLVEGLLNYFDGEASLIEYYLKECSYEYHDTLQDFMDSIFKVNKNYKQEFERYFDHTGYLSKLRQISSHKLILDLTEKNNGVYVFYS